MDLRMIAAAIGWSEDWTGWVSLFRAPFALPFQAIYSILSELSSVFLSLPLALPPRASCSWVS